MKLNIIGSGGHARSLIPLALKAGQEVQAVYDDSFSDNQEEIFPGVYLAGGLSDVPKDSSCLLALGNNELRASLFEQLSVLKLNLRAPSSEVDETAELGEANQIFSKVFVNALVHLGSNNILNSSSVIEHEVNIGSHNHIACGAVLCGRVRIGNLCHIGANATVNENVVIGDRIIIGSGSLVTRNILEPGTYVGTPARRIK